MNEQAQIIQAVVLLFFFLTYVCNSHLFHTLQLVCSEGFDMELPSSWMNVLDP